MERAVSAETLRIPVGEFTGCVPSFHLDAIVASDEINGSGNRKEGIPLAASRSADFAHPSKDGGSEGHVIGIEGIARKGTGLMENGKGGTKGSNRTTDSPVSAHGSWHGHGAFRQSIQGFRE